MSLDGLRAWIGEVERKLTMRTRVFLVLVAIAVGGAGAATYLAIDAQNEAVTKSDLQAVRDELSGSSTTGQAGEVIQLKAELEALRSEIAALRSEASGGGEAAGGPGGANGGAVPSR